MGGIALLARELGNEVSGSDANVYPPMSTQLEQSGIKLMEGDNVAHLKPMPDLIIVGNAWSRGSPLVEEILNRKLPYVSGPQWIDDNILQHRWVLAVSGTHGKTTTSSMLAWMLEYAGMAPGFLVGGVLENFGLSARLGKDPFFVIEADEYDTAFFDKRSKFVHYHPETLIINNVEFDHADIFPDLDAIKRQFHHLVRTVPGQGLIVRPQPDANVDEILEMGCWTADESFGEAQDCNWRLEEIAADYSEFRIHGPDNRSTSVKWPLIGRHNALNAVAAVAAARHAGVSPDIACDSLAKFSSVKRRLEVLGVISGVSVYDDFAHHPTAFAATLEALRARVGNQSITAIIEPRSNTMRMGVHKDRLATSLNEADSVLVYQPSKLPWNLQKSLAPLGEKCLVLTNIEAIVKHAIHTCRNGDHILIMSNGGFGGIHDRIIEALTAKDR